MTRAHRLQPSWRLLAAVALALVGVASGLAFAVGRGEPSPTLLEPNSVGYIDAQSGQVTRSFPVGLEPSALTEADDSVWVANYREQTVTRVDRESGPVATIPVGGHPTGITFYRGRVWVWTLEELLVPIDPRFDRAGEPISVAVGGRPRFVRTRDPGRIVAGGGFLWMTAPGTTVLRVDPDRPGRALSIVPDVGANGPIAYGERQVWVAGSEQVVPIPVDTRVPRTGATVGGFIHGLAYGSETLWVVNGGPQRMSGVGPALRRLEPRTRLLQTSIAVGQHPRAVAVAADSVWVAGRDGSEGTIYRVDPVDNRVIYSVTVGSVPTAIAADDDGVWVAVT